MAAPFTVISGWAFEEIAGTRFDSLAMRDLAIYNEAGRIGGPCGDFGINIETYVPLAGGYRHTRAESAASVLNNGTFSTWFHFNSSVPMSDTILFARKSGTESAWAIGVRLGQLYFATSDGTLNHWIQTAAPAIQTDHMIGVSYNGATRAKRLFLNGSVVATGTGLTAMSTDSIGASFGSLVDGGLPFDGVIDGAFFTEAVLTDDDWTWAYNGGVCRTVQDVQQTLVGECILKRDKI